jgi:hypothetical protein
MSDDISKKVLIEIDLALDDAKTKVQAFTGDVNELAKSVKANKAAITESKAATAALTAELTKGKVEQQQVKIEIDKVRLANLEAAKATKASKDAIVLASGSYAEAQKRLSDLGKAIKNTENGFKSTNPAIKAQITEYNKLNAELKKFDAQMGNHQRSVGNYEGALKGLEGHLDRLIPGFGQLQGILKGAASGFNAMGSGATEAGEAAVGAEDAVTAGALAAGAAIAAVTAAIIIEGTYLLQFQKYADGLSKTWAGIKAGSNAVMNAINGIGKETESTGNSFVDLGIKASVAFGEASAAQGTILETARLTKMSAAQTAEENDKIRKDMLIIRNIKSNEVTVEKAYQEALKLTGDQYERNKKIQEAQHEAIIKRQTAGFGLNRQELDGLTNIKGGYTAIIKLAHDLVAQNKLAASSLDEIVESAKKGIEIEGTQEVREQMIQNREDQKQAKLEKQHQKELSLQQQEANELAKIKQETEQAESERQASIAKMLGYEMDSFSKELSQIDENHRQKLFKEKEFIEKMQVIVDSKKSTPKEKSAAKKAIGVGKLNMGQSDKEYGADTEKAIETHNEKIRDLVIKAGEDEKAAQIANIKDATERELANLDLQEQIRLDAYQKQNDDRDKELEQLKTNRGKFQGDERDAIDLQIKQLQKLQDAADKIEVSRAEKTKHDKLKIIKDAADKEIEITDQVNVLKAEAEDKGGPTKEDKALLAAEKKALTDKYNIEISQENITNAQKLLLREKYLKSVDQLETNYRIKQFDKVIKWEELVTKSAFNIVSNAIRSEEEYKTAALNRQKSYELQNQALTSTQKHIIEEKYRIAEGQAKVKAFKQEQKLNILKAIMSGAMAIQKTTAELGWPASLVGDAFIVAQTAIEVATIASQKPPAYATGGIHYDSDGRGGVLPGYSKKDNMNARLRSGEGIVVSEAMRDPWAKSIVSAINQSYGGRSFDNVAPINWTVPGFASGGVFNNYLPTGDNGLRPQITVNGNSRMHPDDIGGIVNGISGALANLPAPIMDIKDVNHEQGKLSVAIDRITY